MRGARAWLAASAVLSATVAAGLSGQSRTTCDSVAQLHVISGETAQIEVGAAWVDSALVILKSGVTDRVSFPDTSERPVAAKLRKVVGSHLPLVLLAIMADSASMSTSDEQARQLAAWIYGELRMPSLPVEHLLASQPGEVKHPQVALRAFRALTALDLQGSSTNGVREAFLCQLAKGFGPDSSSPAKARLLAGALELALLTSSEEMTRVLQDASIHRASVWLVGRGYLASWRW